MYYNGSLNGFWTGHSDMRLESMALASPKPIFLQGCRDHGPHCKVGVQGPNRPGGPMQYNSYLVNIFNCMKIKGQEVQIAELMNFKFGKNTKKMKYSKYILLWLGIN